MSDRLFDAVRAVHPDVSADELTDAVWLVGEILRRLAGPRPGAPEAPGREPVAARGGPTPDHGRLQERGDGDGEPPSGQRQREPRAETEAPAEAAAPGVPAAEWHLPSHDRLLEHPMRVAARSPAVAAVPDTLAMARALRPLRRRMPSRTAVVLDEEETVRSAADGDLWVPVSRPARDRWLELALVVDDSASMVIWRQAVTELRELFGRLGAFRDVRVWRCDTDLRAGSRLTLRPPPGAPDGAGRDIRELVDPAGRRVTLLVSDCVGRAWTGGQMAEALRLWGAAGPVAVIQTLPQRLWAACGPKFVPVRMAARRPGAPNTQLEVAADDELLAARGMPVPVLELEARWFAQWSALVAGTGRGWVSGTAIFTGDPGQDRVAISQAPVENAEDMLDRYVDFASTDAQQLAKCLAAAPLNLPVMRLVQRAMLPWSRPSALAEVFLGGLLCQRTRVLDRPLDPDEVEYDFAPGVRDRLLSALSRPEKLAVLTKVSDHIAARLGSPMDFRAFLAAEGTAVTLLSRNQPFARVALHVLADMGGRYGEAARRLHALAHIADPPGSEMSPSSPPSGSIPPPAAEPLSVVPTHPGERVPISAPSIPETPATSVEAGVQRGVEVSTQPAIFGGVPFRNPHFTGRDDLLLRLRSALERGSTQMALLPHALHGLGGVGKSQLAVEYAYRYATQYDLVWWVPAESATTVRPSLVQLAEELGLPISQDASQTIINVLAALRTGKPYGRWLIVFDNADRPEDLREYIPLARGHVLITSRNSQWAEVASQLEVNVFDREESVALLRRRGRGISESDAQALAEKLGDLPLALDQAAAWQAETGMPVRDLLRLLDERMRQLLDETPPANYPATVMATWDLAFNRLREQSPGAAQLLELCAFFGAEPISVSLLWDGRHADLPSGLARVLRDDIMLRRAIRDLNRYALAKVDPNQDRIEIHRLVQAVLRERLTPEQREATRDAVHSILGQANPGDPDNPRNWDRHAKLRPHVLPSGVIDAKTDAGRRVALDQIRYRFMRGDYARCRYIGQLVVDRWRQTLGPDHELTLVAQRHLAVALRLLGERSEAAELNQQTYQRFREVLGEEHEHSLFTANSVGADLRLLGQFREARKWDERVLAQHERVLGADDPATLRMRNNLAVDLRLLGDFTQAQELDLQTHRLREALLGTDHPATWSSLGSVGRNHFDAGRYGEARSLLAGALPRMRERLGDAHATTLIATRVLVVTLRRMGALAEARQLAEEMYQLTRQVYTEVHDFRLSAALTYANTLLAVGELSDARSIAEEALRRYEAGFGEEHPFTLAAKTNLGIILRAAEEHAAARTLDEGALVAMRQVLGEDHPYTLTAMLNLSNDCAAAHDHRQARELTEEAYRRSREVRGDTHPHTIACAHNHSLDLRTAGEVGPAQALFEDAQAQFRRLLGHEHPVTRAAADGRRLDRDIEVPAV